MQQRYVGSAVQHKLLKLQLALDLQVASIGAMLVQHLLAGFVIQQSADSFTAQVPESQRSTIGPTQQDKVESRLQQVDL